MTNKKLTKVEKEQVIRWLIELNTPQQVVSLLKKAFGKEIVRQTIDWYQRRYKDVISAGQRQFLQNLEQIPEFHKAVRLLKLHDLLENLQEKLELPSDRWIELVKEYRGIIKQIADEVGDITERIEAKVVFTDEQLLAKLQRAVEEKRANLNSQNNNLLAPC